MNWNYLITFGIGIVVYLVGLLVWGAIKRHRNKKHFDKEVKEHEESNKQ